MRSYVSLLFLRRFVWLSLAFLGVSVAFLLLRSAVQLQPLSVALVLAVVGMQLPHVVYLAAGLAGYWTVDHLSRQGQMDLLLVAGGRAREIGRGLAAPGVALTVVMLMFNVTLFRKASTDLSSLRSVAQLQHLPRELARNGAFRLGGFQLLVGRVTAAPADTMRGEDETRLASADRGEPANGLELSVLPDAILSFERVVIEPDQVQVKPHGVEMSACQATMLEPPFSGYLHAAEVLVPDPSPVAASFYFETKPTLSWRGVALALNILLLTLAAWPFAWEGVRWGRRRWWLLGWLGLLVLPVASAESMLAQRYRETSGWWSLSPALVPLAAAGLLVLLLAFRVFGPGSSPRRHAGGRHP